MATWINNDGLPIDFGLDEARFGLVAGYKTDGDKRYIEILVEVGNLVQNDTVRVSDKVTLPKGCALDSVEIAPKAGTFGGAGTLDIGLSFDGSTTDDPDGILDGLVAAELNGDGTEVAGAYVTGKTILAERAYITFTRDNTAITGPAVAAIRLFYVIPKKGDQTDTLVYVKP